MLLRRVETFLREQNMPPTRFGRLAVGDPRFVGDLRRGRTPREETERKVDAWMAEERRQAAKQPGK